MKLPDFLVVGAQKSGTTSLFLMLGRHPELCLPARKEVQFFSSDALYPKGLDWYAETYFAGCAEGRLAGEVSPQYLYSTKIARRVHDGLPGAKIIAILRAPIDRAYSQYLMSVRRGQEVRPVAAAFAASALIGEDDAQAPESERYFQFSDYERVLSEYLALYGRDRILVLFQEDLDRDPRAVLRKITDFLGIADVEPANVNVRAHKSGAVRFKALERLTTGNSGLRRVLRAAVPRKLRPTLVFWTEILNIKPVQKDALPGDVRALYRGFEQRQVDFLRRAFDLDPPWPDANGRP